MIISNKQYAYNQVKDSTSSKITDLSVSVPLRITDINYGNHLGNNAIVDIVNEARVRFLKQHGFS